MARLIGKTSDTLDAVPLERWLEAPPPRQELTYDGILSEAGIADMKEQLGEYLSDGSELVELAQMDEEDLNDDILDDLDLGLAAEVKARFRAKVAQLSWLRGGSEQPASQPDAVIALKEAAGLPDDEGDEQTVGVGEMQIQQRIDAAVAAAEEAAKHAQEEAAATAIAAAAATAAARISELEARLAQHAGLLEEGEPRGTTG